MKWTYNTGIFLYGLAIRFFALFNTKARKFIDGRKAVFEEIAAKIPKEGSNIWFHFASLGEFEQGRPVMEELKRANPEKKLIVTFFSPSGYEIRKNYALANGVFYLPMDTAANAKRFISLINPEIAVFTKYEFWYHYFKTLHEKGVPFYLISGIFRKDQLFFKWYGGFYRKILSFVTWFFVQNTESAQLLKGIGYSNAEVNGDTRFDRVAQNAAEPADIPSVKHFCAAHDVMICGSTWPEDEQLIASLPAKYPDMKFIIAPHEVDGSHIAKIEQLFPGGILFSDLKNGKTADSNILIINNIGMLSSLYQYGKLAYIGGGFGAGIHNTLEAAAFGLPVIFGPAYDKFQEAKDLIALGGAISINNVDELHKAVVSFMTTENASAIAEKYVNDKKGATAKILAHVKF